MNERIRELAGQARDWGYAEHSGYTAQLLFEQKFAELIVQKCMGVALKHTPYIELCDYSWLIYDKIKEHFGIEE